MRQISEDLYVGDIADAARADLAEVVTAVVSATHADPEGGYAEGLAVHEFPMVDGPRNDYEVFRAAADRVGDLLGAGETVLVHCSAGVSRSVSVTAAALAARRNTPVSHEVERCRADLAPHPTLLEHAERYVEESD